MAWSEAGQVGGGPPEWTPGQSVPGQPGYSTTNYYGDGFVPQQQQHMPMQRNTRFTRICATCYIAPNAPRHVITAAKVFQVSALMAITVTVCAVANVLLNKGNFEFLSLVDYVMFALSGVTVIVAVSSGLFLYNNKNFISREPPDLQQVGMQSLPPSTGFQTQNYGQPPVPGFYGTGPPQMTPQSPMGNPYGNQPMAGPPPPAYASMPPISAAPIAS